MKNIIFYGKWIIKSINRVDWQTHFSPWQPLLPLPGKVKLNSLADSAHCECGSEEQTPAHILQTCPYLETVRQQFCPEDTEVGPSCGGKLLNYSSLPRSHRPEDLSWSSNQMQKKKKKKVKQTHISPQRVWYSWWRDRSDSSPQLVLSGRSSSLSPPAADTWRSHPAWPHQACSASRSYLQSHWLEKLRTLWNVFI